MKRHIGRHGMVYVATLGSLMGTGLVATSAGAAVGSPSAPRAVHASGTATTISVKWSRPASTGATPIREYVVTSKPSARSCTTKTTTCSVKGLSLGSSYTFSVVAKNSDGASAKSTSNRIKVAKASTYFSSQIALFQVTSSLANTAIANAQTTAQQKNALSELAGSYDLFLSELQLEKWPSSTAADMASFIADTRQLETLTLAGYVASSSSSAAANFEMQQSVGTKVALVGSKVSTDLGYSSTINPPITTTPTPVALNTVQTIHDLYGDPVSVTATQLVDPATAAAGSGLPDSGYRFVAVELTLSNPSTPDAIDGDANYSMTVTGSDGQTYSADYGTVSDCVNFELGVFQLPLSDSATGCVVFELPTSVTVQSIQFTLAPGYLDTAEWTS